MIPQLYRLLRLHLPAKAAWAAFQELRRRVLVTERDWKDAVLRHRVHWGTGNRIIYVPK